MKLEAEKLSSKLLRVISNPWWPVGCILHWYPACEEIHQFAVGVPFRNGAAWSFDGNTEAPTFTPSMNIVVGPDSDGKKFICHYFLKAGMLEYLSDCTHAMKGTTIPLPDMPDIEDRLKRYNGGYSE